MKMATVYYNPDFTSLPQTLSFEFYVCHCKVSSSIQKWTKCILHPGIPMIRKL